MSYRKRHVILMIADACTILLAILVAYLLRFDFQIVPNYFGMLPFVLVLHWLIILTTFYWIKLYNRIWQYASIGELIAIVKATTISELFFVLVHKGLNYYIPDFIVPQSIYVLIWILTILGVGGSRFVWRIVRDNYFTNQSYPTNRKRALIVGAGSAGAMVVRDLKQNINTPVLPVAFVDDDPSKQSLQIMDLPIIGSCQDIPEIVDKFNIRQIIIAIPSASKERIAEIVRLCKMTKVNVKILPGVSDIVDGKVSLKMIRDVDVEDLLGREPVKVDIDGIADYIMDEVVLVTGAGGSIGSELCRQIATFKPQKLLLLGHGENSIYDIELELRRIHDELIIETIIADIQDHKRLKRVFTYYQPSVVFHAAAHKHVPLMERNPAEAVKNNILGTRNVANCAHENGVSRFVLISTDKAVNPTSVMGATKRVAEMIVQGLDKISDTRFVAVRFGNVLGSRGSVVPVFKRQIEEGGPVTVTHPEMMRYFMTIPEAVQLVIQAGALAKGGEIFILDMGNPVKIVDLARDLIKLSGLEPGKDIRIEYTGIRPGEKLYEELLTDQEGTRATKHDRIYIGKPLDISLDELFAKIKRLEDIVFNSDSPSESNIIKDMLENIVSTVKWSHNDQPDIKEKSGSYQTVASNTT